MTEQTDHPARELLVVEIHALRVICGGRPSDTAFNKAELLNQHGDQLIEAGAMIPIGRDLDGLDLDAFKLLNPGRDALRATREAHGTVIGGRRHLALHGLPTTDEFERLICGGCKLANGAEEEWPCPPASLYWPDLEEGRYSDEYDVMAMLLESGRTDPLDASTALMDRLIARYATDDGAIITADLHRAQDLFGRAVAEANQVWDIAEQQGALSDSTDEALRATNGALAAYAQLDQLDGGPGAQVGADIVQLLTAARVQLRTAQVLINDAFRPPQQAIEAVERDAQELAERRVVKFLRDRGYVTSRVGGSGGDLALAADAIERGEHRG